MAAFSENLRRVHKHVNDGSLYHSSTPFAVDTGNNGGGSKIDGNTSPQKRMDGKRAFATEHFNIHGSPDMRNILAGRDISNNISLSQKRMTKTKFSVIHLSISRKCLLRF